MKKPIESIFEDLNLQKSFEESTTHMKLPEGGILINAGEVIRFIPLVKSGCIRVLRQGIVHYLYLSYIHRE